MTLGIPLYPVAPPVGQISRRLGRLAEELAAAEAETRTAAIERETALAVGRWLVAQGKAVITALAPVIGPGMDAAAVAEAVNPAEWDYLIAQVMRRPYGGAAQLGDIISGAHRRGYIAGSSVTRAQLGGKNTAFFVGNDDAAAYARANAARRVTAIDETTRRELNGLISRAVAERKTWRETAALIEERYADMAGPPLFPSRTHRRRAQMIAAFETRDAYEAGGLAQARRYAAAGMAVEKRWVFLRDGRARDAHRDHGGAGWVELDHVYADGAERPPSDGNCRCVMMYRVRGGGIDPDTDASAAPDRPAGPSVAGRIAQAMTWAALGALVAQLTGGDDDAAS